MTRRDPLDGTLSRFNGQGPAPQSAGPIRATALRRGERMRCRRAQNAGHERTPAGAARLRTPDPYLGAVQAQLNTLRGGVGEDVGQRVQTQSRLARDSEAPGSEERADLMDGPRDGGAVHAVEDGEGGVRKLEPQDHQGAITRSVKTS